VASGPADTGKFIEVAVPLPLFSTYTYQVPPPLEDETEVGRRVLVPFGRRRLTGFIVATDTTPPLDCRIKSISDLLDPEPIFPPAMVPFFRWTADYYLHPLGEVIQTALPAGAAQAEAIRQKIPPAREKVLNTTTLRPSQRALMETVKRKPGTRKQLSRRLGKTVSSTALQTLLGKDWLTHVSKLPRGQKQWKQERFARLTNPDPPAGSKPAPARAKIIHALKAQDETRISELKALTPSAARIVKSLAAEGHLAIIRKPVQRDPFGEPITPDSAPRLTDEQDQAVQTIAGHLGHGFSPFLLAGVTGSGKTEVYLQLAARAIARKLTVIVLVPEIALISQAARRFRARFGEDVAVLHSGLTAGERMDQWWRIARREVSIVIGARSAIFAPVDRLGLIVVDEEHDPSYKQETGLRYNARDLALLRAHQQGAVALLGSATPSVQTYYNVQIEKFREVTLTRRVARRALPAITIVDLREIRDMRGTARFFSPELKQALSETLARGEQALLFLNRRGFASFPVCGFCGKTLACPNCDISLTYHQGINAHRCHWCGFSQAAATTCPHCGAQEVKNLGLGTERLEKVLAELYPRASIARVDRDTISGKGRLVKMLKAVKARQIDILVGTQMIAKGHDFPHITLVGVICADTSLNIPDFRAGERTFQLLAQVAGRAGRGTAAGRVILQTYAPGHFTILAAQAQDFQRFYHQEIVYRKALNYPPFTRLVHLKISGSDAHRTAAKARKIGDLCRSIKGSGAEMAAVEIMGPIEAGIARIANRHRWQILLKTAEVAVLHRFVRELFFAHPAATGERGVKIAVDVDPYLMT